MSINMIIHTTSQLFEMAKMTAKLHSGNEKIQKVAQAEVSL